MIPLSLGNIFLLKEKGGMRESIPRQVDEKCGGSPRRDKSGVLEEEERTNFFCFFSIFLSLSHIKVFFFSLRPELMITQQTTQFKLCSVQSLSRVRLFATP